MSVVVLLEIKVKPEAVDEVKGFLREVLPDTRAYAGCQGIDIYNNADDPTNFVFYERWDSSAHYQKYLSWRTETGVLDKLGSKLAGPPSIRYYNHVGV